MSKDIHITRNLLPLFTNNIKGVTMTNEELKSFNYCCNRRDFKSLDYVVKEFIMRACRYYNIYPDLYRGEEFLPLGTVYYYLYPYNEFVQGNLIGPAYSINDLNAIASVINVCKGLKANICIRYYGADDTYIEQKILF